MKNKRNEFKYLTGKDGHYLYKKNTIFEACVKTNQHPDHQEIKPFFKLTSSKIPHALITEAVTFLRTVYDCLQTEAIVLLCYDEEQGWSLFIPKQKVSGASLEYENDENKRVVGSIHSHPCMTINASMTDEHDEANFDGIHIIVDPVVSIEYGISVSASVNANRFQLNPEDIIQDFPNGGKELPAEWLQKVIPTIQQTKDQKEETTKIIHANPLIENDLF